MKKCIRGKKVVSQRSPAGYYIGTVSKVDGYSEPNCRVSSRDAKTPEEAENLPLDRQSAMENEFCNGCDSCQIKEG